MNKTHLKGKPYSAFKTSTISSRRIECHLSRNKFKSNYFPNNFSRLIIMCSFYFHFSLECVRANQHPNYCLLWNMMFRGNRDHTKFITSCFWSLCILYHKEYIVNHFTHSIIYSFHHFRVHQWTAPSIYVLDEGQSIGIA